MKKIQVHNHTCQAIVVSCMDFRFRKFLHDWTTENISGGFDRLALAGGVKNLKSRFVFLYL